MHKVPFLASIAFSVVYKRRVLAFNDALNLRVHYLRGATRNVNAFNSLQTGKLMFMVLNLTSLVACIGLTGFLYFNAFYKYYLRPIEGERDLLAANLRDIEKYRNF